MDEVDRGIEAIAEEMWSLIKDSSGTDWHWVVVNYPQLAADLRLKAKVALERGGLVRPRDEDLGPTRVLDLRFKDIFVGRGDK